MDFDDWEFLDFGRKSGKDFHFDDSMILEMDYFVCPSPTPRGFRKSAGENSRKEVPAPRSSDASSGIGGDAPQRKFKGIEMKPLVLPNQHGLAQVFFRKTEENEFVSMSLVSPRIPSSPRGIMKPLTENEPVKETGTSMLPPRPPSTRGIRPEPMKENQFFGTSMLPPRSPSSIIMKPFMEPEPMKENQFLGKSMWPPRSPSSRGIATPRSPGNGGIVKPYKEPEPMEENQFLGKSMLPPRSPSSKGVMKLHVEPDSMAENNFLSSMSTPRSPSRRRFIKPHIDLEPLKENQFPGMNMLSPRSPSSRGSMNPHMELEPRKENQFLSTSMSSPKLPTTMEETPTDTGKKIYQEDKEKLKPLKDMATEVKNLPGLEGLSISTCQKPTGIKALRSIGVAAAATLCIFALGAANNTKSTNFSTRRSSSRSTERKRG